MGDGKKLLVPWQTFLKAKLKHRKKSNSFHFVQLKCATTECTIRRSLMNLFSKMQPLQNDEKGYMYSHARTNSTLRTIGMSQRAG